MSEIKIMKHRTIFIEKAIGDKGHYVYITKDPYERKDARRSLIKAMAGSVKHPTGTSSSFKLKNGSKVTVLVHHSMDIPQYVKADVVYFDRTFN